MKTAFEEYFNVSEQLPTYIRSKVLLNEDGTCAFAGAIVLQPLPFADEATLKNMPVGERLAGIVNELPENGVENTAKRFFSAKSENIELRFAQYKGNCSKAYIGGMLVTLGRAELDEIVRLDGAVKVHCHYCNHDYAFDGEDVAALFKK